jgi:hypothetical protein
MPLRRWDGSRAREAKIRLRRNRALGAVLLDNVTNVLRRAAVHLSDRSPGTSSIEYGTARKNRNFPIGLRSILERQNHRGMVIAARMAAWAFTCLSQPFTWLSFGPSLGEFPGRFAVLAQSRPSLSASGSPYTYLPYWLIVWPRSRGARWPRLSWDCRRVIQGSWLNTRIAAKLPCQIVGNDCVSDDPKKRSRAWIGWTLIAVFVLYPRSIGPSLDGMLQPSARREAESVR